MYYSISNHPLLGRYFGQDFEVQSKNDRQKSSILKDFIIHRKDNTIQDVSSNLSLSFPTANKLINELIEDKLIVEIGKKETNNGRRPSIYQLKNNLAFAIGVDIQFNSITLSILDLKSNVVFLKKDKDFRLEDASNDISQVDDFISKCIEESKLNKKYFLGIGIGITGRVDTSTGDSVNFFNSLQEPLQEHISNIFKLPTVLENDSRAVAYFEYKNGAVNKSDNALIVNLSRGLGLSMVLNGEFVVGHNGFAGEFGHMKFFESERLCVCGKKGCLGTEVGGYALEQNFIEKIENGAQSLLLNAKNGKIDSIHYSEIIEYAKKGDALSTELIYSMGKKLGIALGNIINLLAPEDILVAGKFSEIREILGESISAGVRTIALPATKHSCTLSFSQVDKNGGAKGASKLILNKLNLI